MPNAPEANPDFVSLRSVVKSFGGVTAVDDVTLHIAKGEFFSLLGPSGCGKTTLMRMIAGFETPDVGSVMIDGEDMAGQPPHVRPVNMMFQSYALFPHLTVVGNIGFGLKQMGIAGEALRTRVNEMMRLVQLDGLGDRKPAALSGGQRQRVALARALARNPKVLLLDEPLAALDRKLRKETQAELKRIQAETGATFIVVTHDQEEAMALSDRIAVMRAGRVAQVGTPGEIYDRPANRFTAGFIGEVNLVSAKLRADGRFDVAGIDQPVALSAAPGAGAGTASLALRPERLQLLAAPRPRFLHWRAVIRARTLLGHSTIFTLAAPGGVELQALVPAQDAAADLALGRTVIAAFRPADARVIGD